MKKLLLPLLTLGLLISGCNKDNKSSSNIISSTQSNIVTSTSSTKPNDSSTSSTLNDTKNNAIIKLTNHFNNYDIDNYSNRNWNKMIEILTKAEYNIYNASNTNDVENILNKAISDLDAVETYDEEKLSEKTVVELNQPISVGTAYRYSLSNISNPEKIMRVKVVLDIDFKNASQDNIYWGGKITIGSSEKNIDNAGYEDRVDTDGNNVPEATRQTINVDVSNLNSSDNVDVFVTYAGGNFDIKVVSLSFYYNNNYELKEEKIEINQSIYNDKEVKLAYNKLKNKGDVYKIELNLKITSNESYTGGTIFVTGCKFTPTNTVNIGNIMKKNETSTGSVYIYPEEKVDLYLAEEFSFTSWWAPASEIMLNYITVYTKY